MAEASQWAALFSLQTREPSDPKFTFARLETSPFPTPARNQTGNSVPLNACSSLGTRPRIGKEGLALGQAPRCLSAAARRRAFIPLAEPAVDTGASLCQKAVSCGSAVEAAGRRSRILCLPLPLQSPACGGWRWKATAELEGLGVVGLGGRA